MAIILLYKLDLVATHLHPENISVTSICPSMHIDWDMLPPNCPEAHVHYDISASNCGSCPNITNYTNVTCISTNESIVDDSLCMFSVRSTYSLESSTCYSEWQSESLKISRCTGAQCSKFHYTLSNYYTYIFIGENGFRNLFLALIPPLAMMLLLIVVLVPLSIHTIKRRSLHDLRKRYKEYYVLFNLYVLNKKQEPIEPDYSYYE